jgi:hypothetical protein
MNLQCDKDGKPYNSGVIGKEAFIKKNGEKLVLTHPLKGNFICPKMFEDKLLYNMRRLLN